jgi:autotransporter strand-loop-strand O-heptosyltransferase
MASNFKYSFVNYPKVTALGTDGSSYRVRFIDSERDAELHTAVIAEGETATCPHTYYVRWRVVVETLGGVVLEDNTLNVSDMNVLVSFESSAFGDTIAWIPYVEEFRKKHGCAVAVQTSHNDLFAGVYPELHFLPHGITVDGVGLTYKLGWYDDGRNTTRNPHTCQTIPLQQIASDILGLEYRELRGTLTTGTKPLDIGKYVCISTCSTAQFKYWNNPTGWQDTVDHLNGLGYRVVVVGTEKSHLKDVIDYTGKKDYKSLIGMMSGCEFFIGLPSGLSWLAWAAGRKCVMITGISLPYCEFTKDVYRAQNTSVCHGCFNDPDVVFDKANWNFCPRHQQDEERRFECTKEITFDMVKEQIGLVVTAIQE